MIVLTKAFIGVGANLDPEANIRSALRLLAREMRVVALSTFYRAPAEGRPEQPDYVNGVVELETGLGPHELQQQVLRRIEAALGRQRSEDKFAARPIDLDLLLHCGIVLRSQEIERRAFVAIPLAELVPDLTLPGMHEPLRAIAARFAGSRLEKLGGFTEALRRELASSF